MKTIKKTKFLSLYDGQLQGNMSASALYDILRFSLASNCDIHLDIGFGCRGMDSYYCRVVSLYDNGTFAVWCKDLDRYINISPEEVVGVALGVRS